MNEGANGPVTTPDDVLASAPISFFHPSPESSSDNPFLPSTSSPTLSPSPLSASSPLSLSLSSSSSSRLPSLSSTSSSPPPPHFLDEEASSATPSSTSHRLSSTSSSSSSSSSSSTSAVSPRSSSPSSPLTPPPTPPTVFSPCQLTFRKVVQNGDPSELKRLLEEREGKINVNLFDPEGQTALHLSCLRGNLELVKLLVRFGADVRLANRDGWHPLHLAAWSGHNDVFNYLMTADMGRRS